MDFEKLQELHPLFNVSVVTVTTHHRLSWFQAAPKAYQVSSSNLLCLVLISAEGAAPGSRTHHYHLRATSRTAGCRHAHT